VAISLFGSKAIDAFLLPVVSTYWQQWEKELATATDIEHRTELLMCQQAVLVSTSFAVRRDLGRLFCSSQRPHWVFFFAESTVWSKLLVCPGENWKKPLETYSCH
jgi:hypothetical protein